MPSLRTLALAALLALVAGPASAIDHAALVENLTPQQAARYERFGDGWTIRGVCGTRDLELAKTFGINTVRGYTLNTKSGEGSTRSVLDAAHALGIKVVVSEWMPHQGKNKGRNGETWNVEYSENVDDRLAKFVAKVEAIVREEGAVPATIACILGMYASLEMHMDDNTTMPE